MEMSGEAKDGPGIQHTTLVNDKRKIQLLWIINMNGEDGVYSMKDGEPKTFVSRDIMAEDGRRKDRFGNQLSIYFHYCSASSRCCTPRL
jgi:hypothetical protein